MNFAQALLMLPMLWTDVNPGDRLLLTQKITLGTEGPSFPAGKELVLTAKEGLDLPGHPLLQFTLEEERCEHPEWTSAMEIITPEGNDESTAAGVELTANCHWEIYLEQKDLLTRSFLGR